MKEKSLFSKREACEIIGISKEKLNLWEKIGLIKPLYINSRKYYTLEEIKWGIMTYQLTEEEKLPMKIVIEKIIEVRKNSCES